MELLDEVYHMESRFGPVGDSISFGARQLPSAPQAQKSLWKLPMVLVGEEAQVKARFGLFGDSANLDERQVYGLHGTYHILKDQFRRT